MYNRLILKAILTMTCLFDDCRPLPKPLYKHMSDVCLFTKDKSSIVKEMLGKKGISSITKVSLCFSCFVISEVSVYMLYGLMTIFI